MKKILLLAISLALFGCEKSEKVVVLTSSGYEPYEMVDTSGNLTGFDIELMELLATEVGIEIEWKDVSFDGIVASLQAGQADIAIAGMTPTTNRLESVDFGDIYYNAEAGLVNYFLTNDGSTYGLNDLEGLIVGAQLGTIQAELITELSTEYNFTVDLRNTNTQIIEEIKSGRIDLLLVESLVADSIINSNDEFSKSVVDYNLDSVYGSAIAFSKDSLYVTQFNEALATIKENGSLDELISKWF